MGMPLLGELAVRGCKEGCSAEKAGATGVRLSCPWALEPEVMVSLADGESCTYSLCLIKMKEKLSLTKIQQFKAFCKLVCNGLHFSGPSALETMTLVNQVHLRLETRKPGLAC